MHCLEGAGALAGLQAVPALLWLRGSTCFFLYLVLLGVKSHAVVFLSR